MSSSVSLHRPHPTALSSTRLPHSLQDLGAAVALLKTAPGVSRVHASRRVFEQLQQQEVRCESCVCLCLHLARRRQLPNSQPLLTFSPSPPSLPLNR